MKRSGVDENGGGAFRPEHDGPAVYTIATEIKERTIIRRRTDLLRGNFV